MYPKKRSKLESLIFVGFVFVVLGIKYSALYVAGKHHPSTCTAIIITALLLLIATTTITIIMIFKISLGRGVWFSGRSFA